MTENKLDAEAHALKKAAHIKKSSVAIIMMILMSALMWGDYVLKLDIGFAILCVIGTIGAVLEFYAMCESRKTAPFKKFGTFAAVLLMILHWLSTPGTFEWFGVNSDVVTKSIGDNLVLLGLVIAVFGALLLQATKRDNDRTFEAISTTLAAVLYIWFLSSFLIKLRHLGADGYLGSEGWNESGTGFLISTVIVSKCADIGGYLIGRKFGKTKMIRRISPNKSYEGLAAGLAMSIGAAYGFWHYGLLLIPSAWMVGVFGLFVGVMGTYGDLAESLLKRGAGTKDTANLVPGFGGTLDIIDSLLVSAPFAYFLLLLFLRL